MAVRELPNDGLANIAGELQAHDALLERRGIEITIGGEPTFTLAESDQPCWLTAAEGGDKVIRAFATARHLAAHYHSVPTRFIGRQYPGEANPRFCFGIKLGAATVAAAATIVAGNNQDVVVGHSGHIVTLPPNQDALGTATLLTVTPDPGVVEVNMTPCSSVFQFAQQAGAVWRAAPAAGLSPMRFRYNGDIVESGGGGQLTFGASSASASPFVRYPHVLPAVVRYLNNHPALSYWFASDCIGSSGQAPRPDEGTRERYQELSLALTWLEHQADLAPLTPQHIWQALAPLLVDTAGNSHRSELNLEKFWNPGLTAHGTRHGEMGVVEFRAVRMPPHPAMLAALAALLRSVIARCVVAHYRAPLIDWSEDLHDRFALPAALEQDLQLVLGDLDEHGLGLPPQLRQELMAWRDPGILCQQNGSALSIGRAIEFWPLVGDVASQESLTARWVDASTERWQLATFDGPPDELRVAGRPVQLVALRPNGPWVMGVRRRVFVPSPGLHPGLAPLDPLVIEWRVGTAWQRISLWSWKPDGGAYQGLPRDAVDAAIRRQARVVVEALKTPPPPSGARWPIIRGFTVDTRMP